MKLLSFFLARPFIWINALTFIISFMHMTRLHSLTSSPSSTTFVAIKILTSPVLNFKSTSFSSLFVILTELLLDWLTFCRPTPLTCLISYSKDYELNEPASDEESIMELSAWVAATSLELPLVDRYALLTRFLPCGPMATSTL